MKSEVIRLIKGRNDVTLTTYILDDSSEMLQGKSRPAVLICPGGAYLCCSDREGEPIAMATLLHMMEPDHIMRRILQTRP